MAANPNVPPRRNRKIVLTLPERNPNACWVCGRALDSHDVLDAKEHYHHVRAQERNGFKDERRIVHFTAAQRDAEARACVRRLQWGRLEKRYVTLYPKSAWLVTLARSYFDEGKFIQGCDALHSFRVDIAAIEAARLREEAARAQDYRDSVAEQRLGWMA
jgi:hypothetical protein